MATIVTRSGKGSPLTHNEVDANFTNLNTAKYEAGDSPSFAGLTVDTNTLYVDSTNNRVGVGTASPATALDVSGTITTDGLTINSASPVITIRDDVVANTSTLQFTTGTTVDSKITHTGSTGVMTIDSGRNASWGGRINFVTDTLDRMLISNNGDISFYEDTGTTPKMVWDSSAEALGIGTSSPQTKMHIQSSAVSGATYRATAPLAIENNSDCELQIIGTGSSQVRFGDGATNFAGAVSYDHSTDSMIFFVNSAEAMRITSTGSVGIGTSSPAGYGNTSKLVVQTASSTDGIVATLANSGSTGAALQFFQTGVDTATVGMPAGSGGIIFKPSGTTERVRITSDGNLLVGTTNVDPAGADVVGTAIGASGYISMSRSSGAVGIFNRKTTDGNILELNKDGSPVGSIGSEPGGFLGIGNADTGLSFLGSIDAIGPYSPSALDGRDNAITLGTATRRFKDLYLSGSTIIDDGAGRLTLDAASGVNYIYSTTTGFAAYEDLAIAGDALIFRNGTSEAFRATSGGNVLVGKTVTTYNTAGISLYKGGAGQFTASNNRAMYLNRLSTDGDILNFDKDGTTVGSIGTAGGNLTVNTNGAGGYGRLQTNGSDRFIWYTGAFYPATDNLDDLGTAAQRFDDIYATNGTIQTSDRNEKQDIEELSEAEQRVAFAAKGLLRKYRWKDAVAEKGDEARIHFGIIAQDLQAAFEAEGLDAGRYGMFISSTWTDEETGEERTRMGVRYSELLAFIIAAT